MRRERRGGREQEWGGVGETEKRGRAREEGDIK